MTLLRSGVPEHEIWVQKTDQIERLMRQRNPEFLFTDSSRADLYAQVTKALAELGMRVDPIPEATSSPRYRLFRIVRPAHP